MQPGVELLIKVDKGAEYCIHCSLFNNSASTSAVTLSVPVCVCVSAVICTDAVSLQSAIKIDVCLCICMYFVCLDLVINPFSQYFCPSII